MAARTSKASRPKKKASTPAAVLLAERVAVELGRVQGVVSVTLGGSWARGTADANSDVDLGLYYRSETKPHIDALRALAVVMDDRRGEATLPSDYGEWGPWTNGGAWLVIEGTRVDWLYRELTHVAATIGECRSGRVTVDYDPARPHGFHNHTYMAEVALAKPLHDPTGVIAGMKALANPYPDGLRAGIVSRHLFEAGFMLEQVVKASRRGDVAFVAGGLYRVVAALVQVLFALNRTWFMNEKGALATIDGFRVAPKRFAARARTLLGKPGLTGADLERSVKTAAALNQEVRALAARNR
jgi:predicted nucleotidyltransferase